MFRKRLERYTTLKQRLEKMREANEEDVGKA